MAHNPQTDYQEFAPPPATSPTKHFSTNDQKNQSAVTELPKELKGIEIHRRLSIDSESDTSSVDENYEVQSIASSIEDQLTWRGRMQVVLHSSYFHLFIIALVVSDALIVLFELLLDVGAFSNILCRGPNRVEQAESCHFTRSFRDMCGPPARVILEGNNISASPGGVGRDGFCECAFRGGALVCVTLEDIRAGGTGVNPALVLHYFSLCILSIFMIEVLLKLIAFRMKYFTHKFEVFDGIVVVISWVLDIASLIEEEAFAAAQLLIILRLWRVVRIVNGAVLASKARSDGELHTARKEARRIIHALHKTQDRLNNMEQYNTQLKKKIKQAGLTPDDLDIPLLHDQNGAEKATVAENTHEE